MGGHTLARHVDKTDAELAERLRLEPQLSAASTYTDRAVAERHRCGGSRCNPAPDLAFQGTVRTTPAEACGPGFPL